MKSFEQGISMVERSRMPKDYRNLLTEHLKTCVTFEHSDLIAKIILFGRDGLSSS